MSRKPVNLCPEECRTYHTKKDVADILGVSVATVYNYIKDGLQENKQGMVYCPWIREFCEKPRERKSA